LCPIDKRTSSKMRGHGRPWHFEEGKPQSEDLTSLGAARKRKKES